MGYGLDGFKRIVADFYFYYYDNFQELIPLFVTIFYFFKEKNKRISSTIGARISFHNNILE